MNDTINSLEDFSLDTPEKFIEKLRIIYPKLVWEIVNKDETAYIEDDVNDRLVGLVHTDAVIFDLFSSDCGRFIVNPEEEYNISVSVAEAINKYNKFIL